MAHEAGWSPSGFDPHEPAVEAVSRKGFDVRAGWELHEARFPEKNFSAITAVDSFCYAWHPYETLQAFYRLLEPGGVLAMRISNKRTVAGVIRALSPAGSTRDRRVSRILQDQFHAVSVERLVSILHRLGFERISIEPWAPTISWRAMGMTSRLAYVIPQIVYILSLGKVNLSPGVLLFAQKAA
jgi:SAM-dependent methyltransferase